MGDFADLRPVAERPPGEGLSSPGEGLSSPAFGFFKKKRYRELESFFPSRSTRLATKRAKIADLVKGAWRREASKVGGEEMRMWSERHAAQISYEVLGAHHRTCVCPSCWCPSLATKAADGNIGGLPPSVTQECGGVTPTVFKGVAAGSMTPLGQTLHSFWHFSGHAPDAEVFLPDVAYEGLCSAMGAGFTVHLWSYQTFPTLPLGIRCLDAAALLPWDICQDLLARGVDVALIADYIRAKAVFFFGGVFADLDTLWLHVPPVNLFAPCFGHWFGSMEAPPGACWAVGKVQKHFRALLWDYLRVPGDNLYVCTPFAGPTGSPFLFSVVLGLEKLFGGLTPDQGGMPPCPEYRVGCFGGLPPNIPDNFDRNAFNRVILLFAIFQSGLERACLDPSYCNPINYWAKKTYDRPGTVKELDRLAVAYCVNNSAQTTQKIPTGGMTPQARYSQIQRTCSLSKVHAGSVWHSCRLAAFGLPSKFPVQSGRLRGKIARQRASFPRPVAVEVTPAAEASPLLGAGEMSMELPSEEARHLEDDSDSLLARFARWQFDVLVDNHGVRDASFVMAQAMMFISITERAEVDGEHILFDEERISVIFRAAAVRMGLATLANEGPEVAVYMDRINRLT